MSISGRAVCGVNCQECAIYKAPFESQAADLLLSWFKEMNVIGRKQGVEDLMDAGPYCKGCLGPRANHWSPDCFILQCCVDEKGLSSCHKCADFPCGYLKDWANQEDKYIEAYQYLLDKVARS